MLLCGSVMRIFIGVTMHISLFLSLVVMVSLLDILLVSLGFSEKLVNDLEAYHGRVSTDFLYSTGSVNTVFV